ncbi:MAG: FAD:protein FMN transferase [Clostridia bacterium]|nr:FAD:protein FMN transferase [Clostridia bacterium]
MKRFISLCQIIFLLFCALALSGCQRQEKFSNYYFEYFDTVTTIVGFENSKEVFDDNCAKIKEKLAEYHRAYSIYEKFGNEKNLCYINENGGAEQVDKIIIDLLLYSKEINEKTENKFNIAMGSVLSIWHQYRETGINEPAKAQLPELSALQEAAKHTDINKLEINKDNNSVRFNDALMKLDVGAIAKGYAAEEIAKWMESENITGYLLNLGGNVRAVGNRADGEKWKIGIENPDTLDKENPYTAFVEIEEESVVTSGSYQRYYLVDGKKYHHIIDGKTLFPADKFLAVTVICKDSALADALSTTLFTMDYEEGAALLEKLNNAEAMWTLVSGEQRFSSGFGKYCVK